MELSPTEFPRCLECGHPQHGLRCAKTAVRGVQGYGSGLRYGPCGCEHRGTVEWPQTACGVSA